MPTILKKITVSFLVMLSALLIIGRTKADVRPVASNVTIDNGTTSVTLTEGSTETVICTAVVTDTDVGGCTNITSATSVFYRTDAAGGAGASNDNNNHYSIACVQDGGSCTGAEDLNASYTCTFLVYYYADPTDASSSNEATDWTCQVTPFDEATGTAATDTIEMSTLVALDVTSTINYGELALASTTESVNQTTTVTNTGNAQIDVALSGYGAQSGDEKSIVCSIGAVPVGNEEYGSSTFSYGAGTDLSATSTRLELGVPQQTDDANPSVKQVYWGLGMPSAGAGGSCGGTVVFAALAE